MATLGKKKLATVNKTQPQKATPEVKSGSNIKTVAKSSAAKKSASTSQIGTYPLQSIAKKTEQTQIGTYPLQSTDQTKETSKEKAAPQKTLAEKLQDIETTTRADVAKKKLEQAKKLGRSTEPARRVSSATKISGLRGLEPRWGQQFYKKKTEE